MNLVTPLFFLLLLILSLNITFFFRILSFFSFILSWIYFLSSLPVCVLFCHKFFSSHFFLVASLCFPRDFIINCPNTCVPFPVSARSSRLQLFHLMDAKQKKVWKNHRRRRKMIMKCICKCILTWCLRQWSTICTVFSVVFKVLIEAFAVYAFIICDIDGVFTDYINQKVVE